ncbi:NAD-binding protein [Nocardiopsis alba]|uniref:NAD-binding protein n=1 Tax=Nocardiopsis alba TaxID=53437 RepID=A0A7K2J043_9ACTN|nr:FAD-dependent monooxygenase [Nocardiopsis alba]MYR35553.1 NAD-binding protein [Nocardiopsis alba]
MRIAVVGAGIAGLTLGLALAGTGVRVRIYERAPKLREVGAGIQLSPNAVRSLCRLGLDGHLRRVGVEAESIDRLAWDDGRLLSRTLLGTQCRDLYGAPYYTLHRADLHTGLTRALAPGTVRLDSACTSVAEHDGGVVLRFADGTVEEADVLVGADGIRSTVRASLMEDEPRPAGRSIYRGLIPADRLPWSPEPRVRLWMGKGQHCVCYPISGGRLVSFAATAPTVGPGEESWSAAGDPCELRDLYRDWDGTLRSILAIVEETGRWSLYDRAPVTRWSGDRTTLVGDAAHPMLPFMAQGANQAIEDAVVLAACLAQADGHRPAAALHHYERLRQERTTRVQNGSRARGDALHNADRTHDHPRVDHAEALRSLRERAWLYGYDAEFAIDPEGNAWTRPQSTPT